jgi:hypothetical protein
MIVSRAGVAMPQIHVAAQATHGLGSVSPAWTATVA